MGQKINPRGFRTGILYGWLSTWYANKHQYRHFLAADLEIRKFLKKRLELAGVTDVEIKRSIGSIDIYIHVSRPGVVIGRGGSNLELLKKEVLKQVNKDRRGQQPLNVNLHPVEVKSPDLSAQLVAERMAQQIEKRYPHRRAKAQAVERVMAAGAKGIKIKFSGRIGGAEIGRVEKYAHGKIPTQTLRADIDYAHVPALTRSGYVGVSVWIYKGEKIA
jgi:small subunit ribosomal protein S3